jgi:hypothetical protein
MKSLLEKRFVEKVFTGNIQVEQLLDIQVIIDNRDHHLYRGYSELGWGIVWFLVQPPALFEMNYVFVWFVW